MWSIDWVSIRQQHQVSDMVGKNLCVWFDGQTGAPISEGVGYLSHEGSFSTSVQLRALNGLVEWSGNPSRWGRPDNVWGYTRMRDVLEVINGHLAEYGLPPFSIDVREANAVRRLQREGDTAALDHSGAVLTRVDLCRNMVTGSAAARDAYLRAASCAVYRGKRGASYPGSVAFGSARNVKIKLYDKGAELRAHTKRLPPGTATMGPDQLLTRRRDIDANEYRSKLANWCDDVGLVRQEVGLGRQALRAQCLRELGDWSDHRAAEVAASRVDAMKIGCSADLQDAYAEFVEAGLSARRAAVLSGIVSRWYMGQDPAEGVSRATWYRYARDVRDVLGLDLNAAPDIAVLTAKVRTVELSPAVPPSWYRHAA